MNDDQNMLDGQVEEQVESGEPVAEEVKEAEEISPQSLKKRLGQQQKKHNREMRAMQDQMMQMQQILLSATQNQQPQGTEQQPMQQQPQQPAIDPRQQMEMQRHYQELERDIAKTADKYDDFDDVVRDPNAPFSASIKEAVSWLDNPGEVLYSLGKNRDELYRILDLPVQRQAKELHKLSKALSMKEKAVPTQAQPKVVGQLKSNGAVGANAGKQDVAHFKQMLRSGRR